MTPPIPIEDFFEDILGKAMRGLSIQTEQLSEKTGISSQIIQELINGNLIDETALCTLASVLNLDPDTLIASAKKLWYPQPVKIEGLLQFNTPWHDMLVNAFLIWDPETRIAAAFDTGTDAGAILDAVKSKDLKLESIFITHTHGDHIADLDTLSQNSSSCIPIYANQLESIPEAIKFTAAKSFSIGNLSIETYTTSGHSLGGTTYFIQGLKKPIAIVGDAMFAGSMGGGQVSYSDALKNNRRKILTLPEQSILCPGHGPMSTIAEEKAHNPFFPEFKNHTFSN